ncbi:polysaccharide deacetylase family sporulation protein PdaB [Paenibacillus sp. BSR1-1]|uniref:polysaccharide deacetylase family sporulation protein PdaB n=1 Tax=Paenibacillus sp. BSR1-1 TaxID=3020845 RepID=UPI0025AF9DE2|nr:polysaccharide deacetylase family sporulation protein PdaB [Paenibacillus sp. BSR1-1]MDN3019704.1 polysaccharide deacetylase family sporulation protein PdaB [Paenibacillus sp. BSR1-1]
MNFFVVLNGKALKSVVLILIAAFFTAWFLYMENLAQIPVFSTKEGPKAVYRGEKDLALTFNIGWGDEKAEPILDTLKKENVKSATFFLSGSWAERHPDLVSRIVKDGFEIGILGYDYVDYRDLEDVKIGKDIAKAQEVFVKLNVKDIKLLRAPTGHFDERALKIAKRYGYTMVHWRVDSKDWTNPGVGKIVANVKKAEKGDIVLLHASDSAKQTAKALPLILQDIRQKGLKLVSVSEMIANGDVQSKFIN